MTNTSILICVEISRKRISDTPTHQTLLFQIYPIVLVSGFLRIHRVFTRQLKMLTIYLDDFVTFEQVSSRWRFFQLTRGSLRLDLLDECIWLLPWLRNAICFEIGFVLNLSSRSKGCSAANRHSRIASNRSFDRKSNIRVCYKTDGIHWIDSLQIAVPNLREIYWHFELFSSAIRLSHSSIVDPFVWMIY